MCWYVPSSYIKPHTWCIFYVWLCKEPLVLCGKCCCFTWTLLLIAQIMLRMPTLIFFYMVIHIKTGCRFWEDWPNTEECSAYINKCLLDIILSLFSSFYFLHPVELLISCDVTVNISCVRPRSLNAFFTSVAQSYWPPLNDWNSSDMS